MDANTMFIMNKDNLFAKARSITFDAKCNAKNTILIDPSFDNLDKEVRIRIRTMISEHINNQLLELEI